MAIPSDGGRIGGAASAAVDAAARMAREAAERAARLAQEKAQRETTERALREQRAGERNLDVVERSPAATPYASTNATIGATAPGDTAPGYSVSEAMSLYRAGERAAGGPAPSPTQVPVPVDPQAGTVTMVDDWLRAGKADIGVGDPAVYDQFMAFHGRGLVQLAGALDPAATGSPLDMLGGGDPAASTSALAAPALAALQEEHPDATFELVAVQRPDPTVQSSGLAIAMTENGVTEHFLIDPPSLSTGGLVVPSDPVGNRVVEVLSEDPARLEAWYQASQAGLAEIGYDYGDAATSLRMATADGFIHTVAQGIEAMPEEDRTAFTQDFAASWLTPYELPADEAIVTVDATALAAGGAPGPISSTVNLDAVDGLSTSTRVPPIATSQEDWRQTMEGLQANPPGNIEDLESEIIRLSDGVTQNEIDELKTRDPNALPALLNSLLPHPDIDLSTDLRLQFAGTGGPDDPENYYSMSFESGVVVVETSLDKLLGDQADLDATYGVGDIPMTIRIPFAAGADVDWNNPRPEDLEALNDQLSTIGSTTLFLHGYQSNREVWAADMQTWMDAAAGDTIGISMAGMGSEGHFLGNGDSPLTPRQYGFHTLEALDRMGLFGKELNVVGHSMGGAAALQMGLAIESLTADGRPRPDVRYVLAEPAPAGDSVPFLTDYRLGGSYVLGASNWIGIQNWAGTTGFGPLEWVAEQGNNLLGGGIVNDLMPDAPEAVRNVHTHFADGAGFEQLEATALGLTSQQEPDPEAVAAFLARNPVLVLAGDADRIVGSPVVEGIFGGASVVPIVGGHYAHLTDPAALDAVRSLFSLSFRPQVPGGGGGVHTLR